MSDGTREPIEILGELVAVRGEIAGLKGALAGRQAVNDALEAELSASMRARQIKTQDGHGLRAMVSVRRDTRISDRGTVEAALAEAGRLDECRVTQLDAAQVKRVAKDLGELLPGMEETATEYLRIVADPTAG